MHGRAIKREGSSLSTESKKQVYIWKAADEIAAAINHIRDARDVLTKDLSQANIASQLADIEESLAIFEDDIYALGDD